MNKELKITTEIVLDMCRNASHSSDISEDKAARESLMALRLPYSDAFNPYKQGSDLAIGFKITYEKLHPHLIEINHILP